MHRAHVLGYKKRKVRLGTMQPKKVCSQNKNWKQGKKKKDQLWFQTQVQFSSTSRTMNLLVMCVMNWLGFRFEPLYCKEEKENQIEHLLGKSSALQNNYNFLKKQKHWISTFSNERCCSECHKYTRNTFYQLKLPQPLVSSELWQGFTAESCLLPVMPLFSSSKTNNTSP